MRWLALLLTLLLSLCVNPSLASAQELTLKWGDRGRTEELAAEFDRNLKVEITGLNRKDYVYKPVIELVPGQPTLPSLPGPGPGPGGAPVPALVACINTAGGALKTRAVTFGTVGLDSWYATLAADASIINCPDPPKTALLSAVRPDAASGTLPLTDLSTALRSQAAGPGWTVLIKVTAEFRPQKIDANGQISTVSTALTAAQIAADYPGQAASINGHLEERVFKINFNPDRHIRLSFGPFVSGLKSRTFDQIADPEEEGAYRIGLTEDSNIGYGLGAFWSVALSEKKYALGVSWGVAYNIDRELDEAVTGLLGLSLTFGDKPLVLHLGAALGIDKQPVDGYTVGDPIGADEEIPLTSSLEAAPFLALGFSF